MKGRRSDTLSAPRRHTPATHTRVRPLLPPWPYPSLPPGTVHAPRRDILQRKLDVQTPLQAVVDERHARLKQLLGKRLVGNLPPVGRLSPVPAQLGDDLDRRREGRVHAQVEADGVQHQPFQKEHALVEGKRGRRGCGRRRCRS